MNFQIRPLSDALGAEVVGLDLSQPLDDETVKRVHRAHLDHLVLVFRDQQITPQQQIDFSRRFGRLDQHPADDAVLPEHPEILLVSTRREEGRYVGIPDGGPMWHSDLAYRPRGSIGSMLYAIEIPEAGGNTGFRNMYAACESLPAHLAEALDGKTAIFLAGRNNANRSFIRPLNPSQKERNPAVTHPVIRVHPETGRRAIFANPQHTVAIEGMDAAESDALLTALFEHCSRPDFAYSHAWKQGDLTFWDNRCVQHIADLSRVDDPAYIRHMHRTTIDGEAVF
jgi:taurine dioxygenase